MIPVHTHTVDILREGAIELTDFGEEVDSYTTVASGVRAVIYVSGGDRASTDNTAKVTLDPCPVINGDVLRDVATERLYKVIKAETKVGFGLDHVESFVECVQ